MESSNPNGLSEKPPGPKNDAVKESNKIANGTSRKTPTPNVETTQGVPHKIPTFGKALMLVSGIVNFGFSFGFPTSLSVYFLDWRDSFHENRAYTASIHAVCVGTLNTAAIIPGLLMSRFGDRATLLLGCFLASLGMIISSFANGIPYMVVSTGVLFGLGCCMINLPTIPCITSVFTTHQSVYIAALSFGSGLTNTVLPFFYTFLSKELGWRGSHLITGGLILQTCISSFILTSYTSTTTKEEVEEKLLDEDGDCEKSNNHSTEIGHQLKLPKTGFLLQGVSMTSLHSSTFGSQILGARSRKNTLESSFKHSRENGVNMNNQPASIQGSGAVLAGSSTFSHDKGLFVRLKSSHPFLFDVVFLLLVLSSSFCLSSIYSTIALMMDFTRSKGYNDKSVSVFLVFIAFLFSMFGKIFTGVMNLIPVVHSFHLLISYGFASCVFLISLIYTQEYVPLCVEFAAIGFTLGGLASVYPKCVLDMNTVDNQNYPLALSINNSLVGFFDVTLPVVMGYTVDTYQTYTLALFLYTALSLVLTIAMTVTFFIKSRQEFVVCSQQRNSE